MTVLRAVAAAVGLLLVAPALAFDLQGHRGARGVAPENTLASFTKALEIGVSTLELDLAMTRDGVLVVHHDARLNHETTRGPDGEFLTEVGRPIRSLSFEELKRYDVGRIKPETSYARQFRFQQPADGERIPALMEVFALAKRLGADHVRFNIETKLAPGSHDTPDPETFARAVVAAVREAGMAERVIVQSFDWRTLLILRRIAPELTRSCLTSEGAFDTMQRGIDGPSPWTGGLDIDAYGSVPKLVKAAGCQIWSPSFRDLTEARIEEAHDLDLQVIPWTVNSPATMDRMIDWEVDGFITDYPHRARVVLAAKGIPLPPAVSRP